MSVAFSFYLVYEVTGSHLNDDRHRCPATLPPLLIGPLLGVYVDRLPKKWIMMGADALRARLALIIPCSWRACPDAPAGVRRSLPDGAGSHGL